MKILNAYAGIGGNRKNWDGEKHDITAIEMDDEIAKVYEDFYPMDEVIVADAHEYILENYKKFDFIWASPPCPTHSRIRNNLGVSSGQNKPVYPDMKLYQEVILMNRVSNIHGPYRFEGSYVIENVIPDYEPLIRGQKSQRHLFWANFTIPDTGVESDNIGVATLKELQEHHELDLSSYDIEHNKKVKMLRNCVHPKIGEEILKARNSKQVSIDEL